MSEQDVCPECGKSDMVGRFRTVEQCVDVGTGEVVCTYDPRWTNQYECGRCGEQWTGRYVRNTPDSPDSLIQKTET